MAPASELTLLTITMAIMSTTVNIASITSAAFVFFKLHARSKAPISSMTGSDARKTTVPMYLDIYSIM